MGVGKEKRSVRSASWARQERQTANEVSQRGKAYLTPHAHEHESHNEPTTRRRLQTVWGWKRLCEEGIELVALLAALVP